MTPGTDVVCPRPEWTAMARDDHDPKISWTTKLNPLDFIAELTQHIPVLRAGLVEGWAPSARLSPETKLGGN